MRLIVNGREIELAGEMSVAEFLQSRNVAVSLVAVEHNLRWTRREDWPKIILKENDRVEIIRMMAGG